MKRSPIKPGKGFKRPQLADLKKPVRKAGFGLRRASVGSVRQRTRLKAGPRMKAWARAWRFLKPRLEAAGRGLRCEFDFIPHACCAHFALDPVHSKKRRLWTGNDIFAVAIGCRRVHQILDEYMTHEAMEIAVLRAIERNGGLILPEAKAA